MPSVFITGTNRGLGLEHVRQYAADGWRVHATCRVPNAAPELKAIAGDVSIHVLDAADPKAIRVLASQIDEPLDVVIANAGLIGPDIETAQTIGSLDFDGWAQTLQVNVIGAMATCEAFLPHLLRGGQKKLVAISSELGSIEDATGGYTIYRSSKAALNMALCAVAHDLQKHNIAVGALHPGWVHTDMGGPRAPVSPKESVTGQRKMIEELKPGPKATYVNYKGDVLPW